MERATRETWAKRVERWRDSGLTKREFAAEIGVNASTLAYWKWRLGTERKKSRGRATVRRKATVVRRKTRTRKSAALTVRPLSFVEVTKAPASVDAFEIELVGGERVRVPPSFEADALARLLAVLGRR